jgi:LacI family transcriptional regulator
MPRPTIRDVARQAGVHPATASRALNPELPGRIAAGTTRRVRAAAQELGYHPDPIARSLRTRRSGVVGVVVPDLTNPVIAPIVRGIEKVLWTAGIACLLADTDNDVEREAVLIDELRDRRCDGLVVSTATRDSATVAALADGGLPTVLVTRDIDSRSLPFVGADDAAGVRAAVAHLADLGHERIAHLTGPPDLSTTIARLRAFQVATRRRGLDQCARLVDHGDSFTVGAGRKLAAEMLAHREDITAIVAGNDMIALGCYRALAEAGRRCPDDVSVVGHNDMPMVNTLQPPLTTVAIPQYELGGRAASRLLELVSGATVGASRELLPTKLVIRGSTTSAPATARALGCGV